MIQVWLSASEIAKILGISRRGVNLRVQRELWQRRTFRDNGGKQYRYRVIDLPEDVQAAYAVSLQTTLEALRNELKPRPKAPAKHIIDSYKGYGSATKNLKEEKALDEADRKIASLRAQILQAYGALSMNAAEFARAFSDGLIVTDIRARLVELSPRDAGLSRSKLYDWLERFKQGGTFALAPQYKDRGGMGASLTQEEKDRLEWLWLDPNKPSVKQVLRILQDSFQIAIGEKTAQRYLNNIPKFIIDSHREGKDYCQNHYDLYITRDYTKLKPLEIINGDYMTQDMLCRKGNCVFRAHLCAFQDMRTRMILGWSLQETANSVGVVRALQMTIERYGLPGTIIFDNGKEFKNYWLCGDQWKMRHTSLDSTDFDKDAGILIELGIKISFTQVRHGQSKPIERFWRTFHEEFDKFEPTHLGSNTALRSDEAKKFRSAVEKMKKEDIEKIPTFEEIETRIDHFMECYNKTHKHSGQVMDDKTPIQVMEENPYERREIPANYKKYLFTQRSIKTIQRNGVLLDGGWYFNPEMACSTEQRVEVRRGLDDAGIVHIFSLPDRKPLFDATCLEFSGNVEEDIALKNRLNKEKNAALKKHNKKKAEFDALPINTPAENYTREEQVVLSVVNGEPLVFDGSLKPHLWLVERDEPVDKPKPKRKLKGIFDD